MEKKIVKFKKLVPEATIPTYAHDGDIGMDVFAVSVEYDRENDVYIYHTGLACETVGHMGLLGMMKSGVYKHGHAFLVNGVGLIDSDQFRGEICYIYKNRTGLIQRAINSACATWAQRGWFDELFGKFNKEVDYWMQLYLEDALAFAPYGVGESVGQLVPLTFDIVGIEETDKLSETGRGAGGFGSSEASKKKPIKKKKNSDKKVKEQ